MDQVIVFNKSLQERLQEYLDVLSGHNSLSISQIKNEWAFFIELTIDPSGWQAIWKIPRLTCELYKIPFPTVILVYVENIHFEELEATVKVLAVQDDSISLPEEHVVPLIQLWPTKDQDKSIALNIQSTANVLDMLRFFYNNLVMAWDYDDDETSDWLSKHLELRLHLHYDLNNGVIPRSVSEHIHALLIESRRLQAKRNQFELEIDSEDEIELANNTSENKKLDMLMDIHVRIRQIKGEIEILENPLLRNVILKQQKELFLEKEKSDANYWLILKPTHAKEYLSFLNQVEQFYPNEIFKFSSNLSLTLEEISFPDTVILNKSKYDLRTVAKLDYGGTVKGMYDADDTILVSQNEEIMLDSNGNVIIEHLTLNAVMSQCGILVRRGKLTLRNCKLIGNRKSSTHQAIIVLNGSSLEVIDSDISDFATAIVGNSGSRITIRNCKIQNVDFGIKVYDNCFISIQESTLQHCKEYGFCVETDKVFDKIQKIGNFDILESIPDINVHEVIGNNNGKGDAIINNEQKIIPFRDLFTNLDLTYSCKQESTVEDVDMEVTAENLSDTVIEKTDSSKCVPQSTA